MTLPPKTIVVTGVAAVTVTVELLLVNPDAVADTNEVPAAIPVTTPVLEFTVACAGVAEVNIGDVQACVDESDIVAVQTSVQVAPTAKEQLVGASAIETTVTDPPASSSAPIAGGFGLVAPA